MKAGFVAVVGRPSAGKSSLVNALCGHKVSIVSPVPQTTRNRIRGIVTRPSGQLVFLDTPGYHLSERRMNLKLREVALGTLEEADVVLYVVDPTREPGEEERAVAARVREAGLPSLVALSKADLAGGPAWAGGEAALEFLRHELEGPAVHPVSSTSGEGLEPLVQALLAMVPEGEPFYDADYYTDQPPEFRIAEILREKAIAATTAEVPHCLYVEIADIEMRGDAGLWVRAFLVVERESQKGILVGRGGTRITGIRRAAEADCAGIFPWPVRIDVTVKTRPKWRASEELLGRLIG